MRNLTLILFTLITHTTFAQSAPAAIEKSFAKHPLTFIENKGQVTDQYGNARRDIQYKTGSAGMSVFIGNGQLHYQWSKAESKTNQTKIKSCKSFNHKNHSSHNTPLASGEPVPTSREGQGEVYTMYRLDMKLQGANPHAQAIAEDKQAYYENYHTTALHSGNTTACSYNKITYKNIYPHIDWVLYIKDNKLEYDFIVNPGGNVNDIKIKYNGATDIAHTDGNIKITTPLGDIKEQNLYAYEQTTNKPVAALYTCHNTTFGFALAAYNSRPTTPLIIDPTLAWGTYYGEENEAYAVAASSTGDIFICGVTNSAVNIATAGAYQTTYNGDEDAFLAKFNSSGYLLWATYYGGENEDYAYGVACDKDGNAYMIGQTYSATNIATLGSHQPVYGGYYDAFLAKFNSVGNLQWATYYGGAGYDIAYGAACDTSGNIYLCGGGGSTSNIATPGSYQDTLDTAGNGIGYLAKFNSLGSIIWGTYFGLSTGGSGATGCVCDRENNIYITGTVYDTGIYATPGCYKSSNGHGDHCYIAKFDSACHLLWSTYYGGDSIDYAYGIACDDSLNVYITGSTNSANGIVTAGAHQTVYLGGNGGSDAFLAKFNDTGALQWSTYYGGNSGTEGQGMACDGAGNIYLTGVTSSSNNIATPGSYQDAIMGGSDAFLAKFDYSGKLSWATYYGGSNNDGANGAACDAAGDVYMAGGTASAGNIATPGSFQSMFIGGSDAFLVKFDTAAVSGIKETVTAIKTVNLYPSPNNGNFEVTGEFAISSTTATIEILNETGQVIYQCNAHVQNGELNKQLNLSVASGAYMLLVRTGSNAKTVKFLIE